MHVGESLQAWRGFSCNILNKVRGKTGKSAEGGSCKESSRRQSRHPQVQRHFHFVMVAQDGSSVNKGLEKNSGPALLAAVLKCMVQRQQLDMLKTSAGAALPQQPPHGASQRQSRSMAQQASMADRNTSFSKVFARQPPSQFLQAKRKRC